jgi:Family of unknown function (DUF5723)
MKRIRALIPCMFIYGFMFAQQNLGIDNSNYAGIHGTFLNPSSIVDSKLKWDINLISVGMVFDNTFLFIPKSLVPAFGFHKIIKGIINTDLFYTNFDPNNPNKLYQLTLTTDVLGPSFHMQIAKKHVIGFTMAGRSYTDIKNIPGHLAQTAFAYLLEKDLWDRTFHDNSTNLNSMSWLEYAVHYGTVLYRKGNQELKGGISLKYLQGIAAAYVKNTNLTYNIVDTSKLILTNSTIDYGRTDYDTYRKIRNYGDLNHGHGFGGDIGFTYLHLRDPSSYEEDGERMADPDKSYYVYRIGISLLDIGAINFNRNAAAYHLQTDSANYSNWRQTHIKSNNQLDQALSGVFYQGDSSRSLTGNHFNMALPTALSIQADWNVYKNFYANATIVKGFGHGNNQGAIRPDTYSITPRYETERYEVSIPLSLLYYNRWQARIGLAVRIYYFFFGGDAPGSLFGLNNFQRTDFYAGLHYFVPHKKEKPKQIN